MSWKKNSHRATASRVVLAVWYKLFRVGPFPLLCQFYQLLMRKRLCSCHVKVNTYQKCVARPWSSSFAGMCIFTMMMLAATAYVAMSLLGWWGASGKHFPPTEEGCFIRYRVARMAAEKVLLTSNWDIQPTNGQLQRASRRNITETVNISLSTTIQATLYSGVDIGCVVKWMMEGSWRILGKKGKSPGGDNWACKKV